MPEVKRGIAAGVGHRDGRSYRHAGEPVVSERPDEPPEFGPVKIIRNVGGLLTTVNIVTPYDKDQLRTITQRGQEQPRRPMRLEEQDLIAENKLKFEGDQSAMEMWARFQLSSRRSYAQKAGMNHPGADLQPGIQQMEREA